MKIETITIRGFRGFNQEQTIKVGPNLTLIYGQNSYGKTSITEAVEWLLYGKVTSLREPCLAGVANLQGLQMLESSPSVQGPCR